jgi:hypothetical protein
MISVPEATTLPSDAAADRALELGDDVGREPVGKRRERALEHEAHQLPVAGHRVLAGRSFRHPPERGRRGLDGAMPRSGVMQPRPSASSVGTRTSTRRADVAERVAALVAVRGGVRQLADPDAVEHDEDDALEGGSRRDRRHGCRGGDTRRSALGVVVARRPRGADARDGVLEEHLVCPRVLDDEGEAIEVADAALELLAVHHPDRHHQPLAAHEVQERILDVRRAQRAGCQVCAASAEWREHRREGAIDGGETAGPRPARKTRLD